MSYVLKCAALILATIPSITVAQASGPSKRLQRTSHVSLLGQPQYAVLSIGRFTTWMRYDGLSNHSPSGGSGMTFPKQTASVVFQDGLVWGGKAFLDAGFTTPYNAGQSSNVRVGGGTHSVGTRAGRIVTPELGPAGAEPTADAGVRIFRIRRDHAEISTDDLREDAAAVYEIPSAAVTFTQMENVRARYIADWQEWPVSKGAPYIERNGTPGYQPPPPFGDSFHVADLVTGSYDEPGVAGADHTFPADQVVWTVYNDLNVSVAQTFAGSNPLGLEMQRTSWAYQRADDLGNVVFHRYRLINRGGVAVTPENAYGAFYLDSVYVGQWSDPDVGDAGNDLVGSDPALSLGYAYNGAAQDAEYQRFALAPPAVGYDFLAGPIVPAGPGDSAVFDLKRRYGFRNLPMSSFSYFSAGSPYSDPPTGIASYLSGTGRWWKMLRGHAPLGDLYTSDVPYATPPGVPPTPFQLTGDPVSGTGWLDGMGTNYSFAPGDRRLLLSTGPFRLAPGDTQEVVIALLAGLGADRLSSIAMLRYVDQYAQLMYDRLFALPDLPKVIPEVVFPSTTEAQVVMTASDPERAYQSISVSLTDADGTPVATSMLYDDGAHQDGGASDGVFGRTATVARRPGPLAMRVHYTPVVGTSFSVVQADHHVVTAGRVRVTSANVVFDNIGRDGKAGPGEYVRFTPTVDNQTPYELGGAWLTGPGARGGAEEAKHSFELPPLAPWSLFTPDYQPANTSEFFSIQVPSDWQSASYPCVFTIRDAHGNSWVDSVSIPVVPALVRPPYWNAGQGPFGGRVEIMLHDSAGGVIAFPASGAYRSADSGLTWTRVADNSISSVAGACVLPSGSVVAATPRGIYRSTDHGSTWKVVSTVSLTAMTTGPNGLLYGRSSISEFCVSMDEGATWTVRSTFPTWSGGPGQRRLDVDSEGRIYAAAPGSIDRSLDSGRTWSQIHASTPDGACLEIGPGGVLFVGLDSALVRSTDHGATWQPMSLVPEPVRIELISIGPSGNVYATGGRDDSLTYVSTDGGASWQSMLAPASQAHALLWLSPQIVMGAARGTPIRSTNDGLTWSEASVGMTAVTVHGLSRGAAAILAATDRGLYRSLDDGMTWDPIGQGLPIPVTSIDAGHELHAVAIASGAVHRSTDGGVSWARCADVSSDSLGEVPVSLAVSSGGVIYVGLTPPKDGLIVSSGLVVRSTNGGLTWQRILDQVGLSGPVSGLATWGPEVVAASIRLEVMLSTNGGATWSPTLGNNLTGVGALGFDPAGRLAAGQGPLLSFQSSPEAPMQFVDGAGLTAAIGMGRISALRFGQAGEMLVGTQPDPRPVSGVSGVFRSTDGGLSFEDVSNGLGLGERARIASLLSLPSGGTLAGTIGEGIYRSASLTGGLARDPDIPVGVRLDHNFPNPFNPETRIRFTVDRPRIVSIKVYSLLGQEIATIVDEHMEAGVYERSWTGRDASGRLVASGIYLLRITSASYSRVVKMNLIR